MKYIILLFALISLAYCSTECEGVVSPSNYYDCTSASKAEDCYCCYLKGTLKTGASVERCKELSKSSIDNDEIYNYISYQESTLYQKIESLNCKSSYITVGLLSLILLLF